MFEVYFYCSNGYWQVCAVNYIMKTLKIQYRFAIKETNSILYI
jgi:hypothetical protein